MTSSSGKFETIVSHASKKVPHPSPKLMASTMKVVKVEMVRQVEEKKATRLTEEKVEEKASARQ